MQTERRTRRGTPRSRCGGLLCALTLTLALGLAAGGCLGQNGAEDSLLFGLSIGDGQQGDLQATIGMTVSSPAGHFIVPENEANGSLTLELVLTSAPLATVTIPVSVSRPTEASLSLAQIQFSPSNWNVIQSLVITGVIEPDTDGNQVTTLQFGAAISSDPEYSGFTAPSITGIILTDDDAPSIVVSAPGAGLVTTEAGGSDRFAVVLTSRPKTDVQVPANITSSDTTEGTTGSTSLTFTTANWNVPQLVTVTGVDDEIIDGDVAYSINLPNSASGDDLYNNKRYYSYHDTINPGGDLTNTVNAINRDNDTPGVTVSQTTRSMNEDPVNNAAGVNEFTVVLTKGPATDVSVPVALTGDTSRASVAVTQLTFTAGACPGVGNWCQPQTITVNPINNEVADGTANLKVELGTIANYGNVDPPDVDVTVLDDDSAGVEVVQLNQSVIEATSQSAFFRLRLNSKPTANVTIPINDVYDSGAMGLAVKPAGRMGTVDKTSVTFTPTNWNVYQDVTFTPVNDDVADGNVQFLIELQNCVSSDGNYSGLKPTPNITVNYVDNDVAGFRIVANNQVGGGTSVIDTSTSATTVSGFATDDSGNLDDQTYSRWTMRLRSQPLASVVVTLQVNSSNTDGTLNTTSLTFTTSNWNVAQPVYVTGASDGTNEGNLTYSVSVSNITGDAAYANGNLGYASAAVVARPSFSIFSCDNDVNNEVTSCRRSGGFTTSEGGGTAQIWFVTKSNPGGNVCIPVNSNTETEGIVTNNGDGSASTTGPPRVGTATITTSNYNTMTGSSTNKVTVTGQDDAGFDGNTQYTLVVANATCGTTTYTSFNPPDLTIRNTDDEQAFEFTAASGNTTENGGTATYGIRLKTQPSADVTFSLACAGGSTECQSVSPTSLTFTNGNWNSYQTVTLTGKDDLRGDGPQPTCVTYGTISSTDPAIDGITPPGTCPTNNDDNDKVIWVVTTPRNPNFNSGMTQADVYCNDGGDGNKPAWGTYKALLADSSTRVATTSGTDATGQVAWVLQPSTRYYLKTGSAPYTSQIFQTNSYGTFTFGTLGVAFGSSETYWTGLNANWTTSTNTCTNWTANGTGGAPHETNIGTGGSTSSTAIFSGTSDCDTTTTRKLICVQQ